MASLPSYSGGIGGAIDANGGYGSSTRPYAIRDVMPLGDSITDAVTNLASPIVPNWRSTFFVSRTDLSSAGSRTNQNVAFPARYERHEGHPGYSTSVMRQTGYAQNWIQGNPARNYIVMVGTANVVLGDTNAANYATDVTAIVNLILATTPTAKILVSKLINCISSNPTAQGTIDAFNVALTTAMGAFPAVTLVTHALIADARFTDNFHVDSTAQVAIGNTYITAAAGAGI